MILDYDVLVLIYLISMRGGGGGLSDYPYL